MAWDELDLHGFLARDVLPARVDGRTLNHDAVIEGGRAVCCDRTEEGVHFVLSGPEAASLEAVANKAVGRVLSDLAATAAEPRGLLAAVAAPRDFDGADLKVLLRALADRGQGFGAPLLGGDLTASVAGLSIVITGWGQAPDDPPGRDRLRVGEVVAVSGPVGGSRAGRHLAIAPRVALGRRAHAAGVRAMMDVSDGLALDLHRLALASNVAIELQQVPVHGDVVASDAQARVRAALFDGEDHELLLGLPSAAAERLCAELDLIPLGLVTAEREAGLWLARPLVEGAANLPAAHGPFERFDPNTPGAPDGAVYVHGR